MWQVCLNVCYVERPHDGCEIEQRPAQAIDLVDDHAIDFARFDVGYQPFERRTFGVAARETSIVVDFGHALPTFGLLALDIGFGRFALGVERIEFQLEALFT